MTTDRRIKRTRDALSNALITLIKTTPLKKISIQSVVDIANVSRSTFYVHSMTFLIYMNKLSTNY